MRIKSCWNILWWGSLLLLFSSCTQEMSDKFEVTPDAYGKPNNIMLVTDQYNWETTIGDSFRVNFEALYPVTPQPEFIYDIRYTKPTDFEGVKIYRTNRAIIILAALDDTNDKAAKIIREAIGEKNVARATTDPKYRMAVHNNRWATDQIVVYWFAPNRSELLKTVQEDYQKVMSVFDKADAELYLQQIYTPGQNLEVGAILRDSFQLNLKIPKAYTMAHKDSTTMWLRRETDKISSNIFIHILPYADSTLAVPEQHKYIRNKLTRTYFATWVDNSYMQIDDRVLPMYYQPMFLNEKQTLQVRGIWGMVNDFMGGSFVTYMIEDEANQRVIFLDGFVHAPGQKKRPEMRKLDIVFSTLDTTN